MIYKPLRTLALILILIMFSYACSSTDSTVVVVNDEPMTNQAAEPDTVDEQFTQLNLALIDSVTNFDPLFAENLSTQRTLTLIYDGLYTLDRQGNPVPQIATSVEVSEDSLEYVFTLNQDKFFHNSTVFNSGVGRRVNAMDIKSALERTAKLNVPDKAAQLLMNVRGFENYFLEQRSVYDPDMRVLQDVAGIQALNRQTLAIVLREKDPNFLKKLASPYLLIYPQEAINDQRSILNNRPIGTGTYQFNRVENNGQIILLNRNNGSPNRNPAINRINLRHFSNESELFQALNRNQIDWIPEIGPQTAAQILNESGELASSYSSSFNLIQNQASRIIAFYLNERAEVDRDWLINRLAYLTEEDISTRGDITLQVDNFEITENAEPLDQYYSSYTQDALTKQVLTELQNIIFKPVSSIALFDIRVPTRQTSIFTRNSNSIENDLMPLDNDFWMLIDTDIYGVFHNRLRGIEATTVPWLLHIDQVRVLNSEN